MFVSLVFAVCGLLALPPEPTTGVRGICTETVILGVPTPDPKRESMTSLLPGIVVRVQDTAGRKTVAEVKTDWLGRYAAPLEPGTYRVVFPAPEAGTGAPVQNRVTVTVEKGKVATANFRLVIALP